MRMEDVRLRLETRSAGREELSCEGHSFVSVVDATTSWYEDVCHRALATLIIYLS